jgi:nucleoside-diphosphate-sugar epimerase
MVECDLGYNTTTVTRPSRRRAALEVPSRHLERAANEASDGVSALAASAKRFVSRGPARGLFELGIGRSITSFYSALAAGTKPRTDTEDAARVLEWCDPLAETVRQRRAPSSRSLAPRGAVRPGSVAVLGAAGFIGRHLTAAFLRSGVPVTAISRRPLDMRQFEWDDSEAPVASAIADLDDRDAVRRALDGARIVVQLATGSVDESAVPSGSMVTGTMMVAEEAAAAGVERMVYASSIAAFYMGRDAPHGHLDDDSQLDAQPEKRGLYTRGKIAAEQALAGGSLPVAIVRPGVVLGRGTPAQHAGLGMWHSGIYCLGWGRGDNSLPIVMVDDVAEGLRMIALESPLTGTQAFNLTAASGLTARDVVAVLSDATGRPYTFVPRSTRRIAMQELSLYATKLTLGRRPQLPLLRDMRSMEHVTEVRSSRARSMGWQPVDGREETLAAIRAAYSPTSATG